MSRKKGLPPVGKPKPVTPPLAAKPKHTHPWVSEVEHIAEDAAAAAPAAEGEAAIEKKL